MRTRRLVALERFGPPEVMRWVQRPMPARDPDEVLVAVEAIGVNFADTMVRRGEYRRDQSLEFIPGFEVAGHVLEGPDDGPAPGSLVLVFAEMGGGYADTVLARSDHVFTLLPGVSAVDAAAIFTQGVTAWYAIHRYGCVHTGTSVVVHGAAGGLGSLCVQLAADLGARTIATASSAEKLAIASVDGASTVLLADPQTLTAGIRQASEGGADVVIDGVGGPLFEPSLRGLALGGRYIVVGSASQQPATVDVRALMPRGQTIVGFVVARVAEEDPAEPQAAFDEVQRLLLGGRLRPHVQVLDACEVSHIHELIESRTLTGKVVLTFSNS